MGAQGNLALGTDLWNLETGELIHSWNGIWASVSSDWTKLLTASPDLGWDLWNLGSGEHLRDIALPEMCWTATGEIAPDGSLVAGNFVDEDGNQTIGVWEADSGVLRHRLSDAVREGFVVGGEAILLSSGGYAIWNLKRKELVRLPLAAPVRRSPDGLRIAAPTGGCLALWDVASATQAAVLEDDASQTYGVVFSADSRRVIVAISGRLHQVFNATTGALQQTVPLPGTMEWRSLDAVGGLYLGRFAS